MLLYLAANQMHIKLLMCVFVYTHTHKLIFFLRYDVYECGPC